MEMEEDGLDRLSKEELVALAREAFREIREVKHWERINFIRDAATLFYARGMRGAVEAYTPEQCWALAKALWEAKPEDC